MTLIPHKNETLVLPINALQVISRLSRLTQPANLSASGTGHKILFNGYVGSSSFKVSRKVNYPQNYMPIIQGKIEASSRGCIVFLKYNLFFSSLMFFSFWTIMSFIIGIFLIVYSKAYLYAAVSFTAGGLNYLITVLNFNKQVKLSREALDKALKIMG